MKTRAAIAAVLAAPLLALMLPSAGQAVVPTWPPEGTSTSSTPTLSWSLAADERADALELTPNPGPGAGGGFTEGSEKRYEPLANSQTTFQVGSAQRLPAGTWYWHVQATRSSDFQSSWTPVRSIRVRDENIRLRRFRLDYFNCLRRPLGVDVDYEDNSREPRARWWVDFRRSRRGRRVARLRGTDDDGFFYATRRKPRKLRRGRYLARLYLRDDARHITRSRYRRVRITRCGA